MATWQIDTRNTLSIPERMHLAAAHKNHLNENSAFPMKERAEQRAKVEKNLSVRVAAVYKAPSDAWLKSYVVPKTDPPLDLASTSKPLPPASGAPAKPPEATVSIPPSPPEPPAARPPTLDQVPVSSGTHLPPMPATSPELGTRGSSSTRAFNTDDIEEEEVTAF